MKYILFGIVFILAVAAVYPQSQSTAQIKEKMAQIRRSTNWDDPGKAKKANEEIQKLAKQLILAGKKKNENAGEELQKQEEETAELQVKQLSQIMKSANQGEDADILLAAPVREEIIEEYKDDESPKIKNPLYFEEMTTLLIDMSLPTVQRTIDQMDKYKSIKTLVITGGKSGAPVKLDDLLRRASGYPLEELFIINFRANVSSLPTRIGSFKKLTLLSLINNQLKKLPQEIGSLTLLKTLYVDINPVTTLFPVIGKLHKLENLGTAMTSISEAEIEKIKQLMPKCNINSISK